MTHSKAQIAKIMHGGRSFEEAEELYQQTLEAWKNTLGDEDPDAQRVSVQYFEMLIEMQELGLNSWHPRNSSLPQDSIPRQLGHAGKLRIEKDLAGRLGLRLNRRFESCLTFIIYKTN